MKQEDTIHTVSFYKQVEDKLYANTSEEKPIYGVEPSNLEEFKNDLFFYQDKHLLVFDQEAVQDILVKTPEEAYHMKRTEAGWIFKNEATEIESVSVTNFLKLLQTLEAMEKPKNQVTLKEAGLQPALTKIQLFSAEGQLLGKLKLGNEMEGKRYARGLEDLGTVLVFKSTAQDIPKASDLWKQKEEEKNGD